MDKFEKSLQKLRHYCEREDYQGYDPYDALKSPVFDWPFFRSNKLVRFGMQQLVKRSPVNLRPFLQVPKGLNPVSLGLFIQGYTYLLSQDSTNRDMYLRKISELTVKLEKLAPEGFSGMCWGYDFDWEARYAKIPAYQPTVVATGIVANALFEAWKSTKEEVLKKHVVSAADFVLQDLNRQYDKDSNAFCFSYSPFDQQQVFNASMKGVRLLAQAYALTGDENYRSEAELAVAYTMKYQSKNGAWKYSLSKTGGWIDNYHTGYILDCLRTYIVLCGDPQYEPNMQRGYAFYKENFINSEGMPSFYYSKDYPGDCTAASQMILTLTTFGDLQLADGVARWTIKHMQSKQGSFYFRKFRYYTIKTSFMRWSNAWMFAALAYCLFKKESN